MSVYRYDSKKCVEFSSYERVDAANPDGKLFIVRYLFWQPGLLLPCGVVVGVIRQNRSLEQGMKVGELRCCIYILFKLCVGLRDRLHYTKCCL